MMQIAVPLVDLLRSADGPRDRQLLMGDKVDILEAVQDHYRIKDAAGYEGFIPTGTTADAAPPTHMISARSSQCYKEPDIKSADLCALSFTAKILALAEVNSFIETSHGFVPKQHLRALDAPTGDLVDAAETLLGTPYLWGGNSSLGIDCSGLVEAGLRLAGHPFTARDSGDQQQTLGQSLPPNSPYKRNDLLFWKGHVALVVDDTTMIHANAHHMAVSFENIQTAIERIKAQGDGDVTAHKRV